MADDPVSVGESAVETVRRLRDGVRSRAVLAEEFDEETAAVLVGASDGGEWYRAELAERWERAVPRRYRTARLDSPQPGQEDAYEVVAEWVALDPRPNLVIIGPTGTGKTHLAVAALCPDHEAGRSVMFRSTATLLHELRPGGGFVISDYVAADRFLLDDFGMFRATEWSYEQIEVVVNERWLQERPTIATTNLALDELRSQAGDRVFSRLVGSDAYLVTLTGEDRRLG